MGDEAAPEELVAARRPPAREVVPTMIRHMIEFSPLYPGDSVTGTVESIDDGYSEFIPDPYPILTLATEWEPLTVHATHADLRRAINSTGLDVGQLVTITYVGKRTAGGGRRRFHAYEVSPA